jgi:hypothetical protein
MNDASAGYAKRKRDEAGAPRVIRHDFLHVWLSLGRARGLQKIKGRAEF